MATHLAHQLEQLTVAARATYPHLAAQASAYLKIALAPDQADDRIALMAQVLAQHDLPRGEGKTVAQNDAPPFDSLDEDAVRGMEIRLRQPVINFLKQKGFQQSTFTRDQAAREVITFLADLPRPEERVVALAIMLTSDLTPYAQIPEELIESDTDKLSAQLAVALTNVRLASSAVLLNRLWKRTDLTGGQITMAIAKILTRHLEQPVEMATLLTVFRLRVEQDATTALSAVPLLGLGGALPELLYADIVKSAPDALLEGHASDCQETDCPLKAELARRRLSK